MQKRTIGHDKINQLRHLLFFRDREGIDCHMRRHGELLRPKFDLVDSILNDELGQGSLARWTRPNGGYFVSLNTQDGCARAVVELAAQSGVRLTPAGATFPYGVDPRDRNIRIAPSYPTLDEIRKATEILALCIQVVLSCAHNMQHGILRDTDVFSDSSLDAISCVRRSRNTLGN